MTRSLLTLRGPVALLLIAAAEASIPPKSLRAGIPTDNNKVHRNVQQIIPAPSSELWCSFLNFCLDESDIVKTPAPTTSKPSISMVSPPTSAPTSTTLTSATQPTAVQDALCEFMQLCDLESPETLAPSATENYVINDTEAEKQAEPTSAPSEVSVTQSPSSLPATAAPFSTPVTTAPTVTGEQAIDMLEFCRYIGLCQSNNVINAPPRPRPVTVVEAIVPAPIVTITETPSTMTPTMNPTATPSASFLTMNPTMNPTRGKVVSTTAPTTQSGGGATLCWFLGNCNTQEEPQQQEGTTQPTVAPFTSASLVTSRPTAAVSTSLLVPRENVTAALDVLESDTAVSFLCATVGWCEDQEQPPNNMDGQDQGVGFERGNTTDQNDTDDNSTSTDTPTFAPSISAIQVKTVSPTSAVVPTTAPTTLVPTTAAEPTSMPSLPPIATMTPPPTTQPALLCMLTRLC